jgi:prolipoprotein diacylglyceryltransferase
MRPRFIALLEPLFGSSASWLVPGYATMLVAGALLGAIIALDRTRRAAFAKRDALLVLAISYVLGLAGACAVPASQAALSYLRGGALAAPTGFAAYGGMCGGTLGAVLVLRKLRLDAWRFLDAAAPAIALGYFFARVGCFMAGCDYGAPTSSWIGTTFPAGSHAFRDHVARGWIDGDAPASLPVHPTELYSAAAGLFLFFVTDRLPSCMRGARFVALVVGYGALRSVIELFRGDASRGSVGPLSTAQCFAIATAAMAAFFVARASRSHRAAAAHESEAA